MLAPGDQLAHFRIEAVLGAGGMGEVYVAFDEKLERRVALKLVGGDRALLESARLRMLREARAASGLAHDGIVTVYEIGSSSGQTFIAMELIDGETLHELVERRGKLPPAEAVALLRQICDAVAAAHDAGILHRDLKSANLMIDRGGRVKVLDFGLSKRVAPTSAPPAPRPTLPLRRGAATQTDLSVAPEEPLTPSIAPTVEDVAPSPSTDDALTVHGARMGTPGSAAPELMDGEDADVRTDVFSLGVVLYELVTGRSPFPGGSWDDIRARIGAERYLRPSEAGAPDARLDAVIACALRPARAERFASARDLAEAAADALRPRRRVWLGVGALSVAAAAIAAPLLWPSSASLTLAPSLPLPPKPRALTQLGDCAEAPAFADDHTIVFDRTTATSTDLYALPEGGAPTRLTDGPGWEWRPVPGHSPGHALYLLGDPTGNLPPEDTGIAEIDLASHAINRISDAATSAAVVAGGDVYYVDDQYTQLHHLHGSSDEIALDFAADVRPQQLAASRDGRWIATSQPGLGGVEKICAVDLAARRTTCLPATQPANARPDFSHDGAHVYYDGAGGIRRIGLDGQGDTLALADADAAGGIAVSPDGATLVYSSCDEHAPLLDVTRAPPTVLVDERLALDVTSGPDGMIAWVRSSPGASVLMRRDGSGAIRQLTQATLGRVSDPSFDASGDRVAFAIAGDHPGIYTAHVVSAGVAEITQLTADGSDMLPLWLDDTHLLFSRLTDAAIPYVYEVDASGGPPKQVRPTAQAAMAIDRHTHEVILVDADRPQYSRWNPVTGKVRPFDFPGGVKGRVHLSPDGRWMVIQEGTQGLRMSRVALDPAGAPELVYDGPAGETSGIAAISDDGHVYASPSTWRGELYAVSGAW